MSAPSWQCALSDFSSFPSDRAHELELGIQTGPKLFKDRVEIIDQEMKGEVPYGSLFAYLFRRFGYPGRGWDNHKDLVAYHLSTPRADMILVLRPYVGDTPHLGMTFLVPPEIAAAASGYPWRHRHAHLAAFGDWVEEKGLKPDWVEGWFSELKTGKISATQDQTRDWKQSLHALKWLAYGPGKNDGDPRLAWYEKTWTAYEAEIPAPDEDYRDPDWTRWSDADPLKPYVADAVRTLRDLRRPVWVRDQAIDPWGLLEDQKVADLDLPDADYATAAGYPSGALGNADPKGFAELHGLILRLGQGNAEAGIAEALRLLKDKLPEGR